MVVAANPTGAFLPWAWLHRGLYEAAWVADCDADDLTIPSYLDRRSGARHEFTFKKFLRCRIGVFGGRLID
jgi:hypothetical protein